MDANGTDIDKTTDITKTSAKIIMTTMGPTSYAAALNSAYYSTLDKDARRKYDYHHQLPGEPSQDTVVAILSLSILVFVCSSLVLLATSYTSGGQSGTLVFLRSLLMSDMLMALYGVTKMVMLLFLHELRVHFFLPDSLFFTASLASSSSLLSLNLDCFLKLARPYKYAQVEKHTVITFMLLVWNAAFVVGFLPLVGWNEEAYTFRFFSFYPWHFLVFNGLVIFICVVICIVCMVSLKKFFTIPDTDPSCFSTRTLEVRKYRHLHRTIVIESAMWLTCYLPFFVYISLACRQCFLGDYRHSDSSIIYFLPVFLAKSLFSAALQAFRTFHVHTVMNKIISDISNMASPRKNDDHQRYSHRKKSHSVATIAYSNPLTEHQNLQDTDYQNLHHRRIHSHLHHLQHHHHNHHHFSEEQHDVNFIEEHQCLSDNQEGAHNFYLGAENWIIHHQNSPSKGMDPLDLHIDDDGIAVIRYTEQEVNDSNSIMGITNLAFRSSIELDSGLQSTKL